jgi:hypothetical protein
MSLTIKVKADTKRVKRFLTKLQKKQIPFATARAITLTLNIAKKDVLRQLDKDIDRPTPFTRRGFRVDGADKTTLTGRLFISPIQNRYLQFQIFGGVRRPRGVSFALPPAKPAPGGIRRDRFGNVPRAQAAKAQLAKGAFSATIGGVPGIWSAPKKTKTGKLRKGSRMRLVLAYEKQAVYRKRYRFFERGQNSIRVNWPRQFEKSFRSALRSAR